MARKRIRIKIQGIFLILGTLVVIGLILSLCFKFLARIINKQEIAYLGSNGEKIDLYDSDYEKMIELPRGTKILLYEKEVVRVIQNADGDKVKKNYRKIKYKKEEYLIEEEDVVDSYEKVVYETEKYVRTSVTLYESHNDVLIAGYAKKGTKLEIIGFDRLNDDGTVNMYKIKNGEEKAYVYSKYLVDTEELALANYNENGVYDIHKNRKFSTNLYGGAASNLDYYPYEKVSFYNNKFVEDAKAYYLTGSSDVLKEIDKYITLAKKAGATAFVVDIKDGALAYKSPVAQTYSPTSYKNGMNSVEFYKTVIQKIKSAGFYTIGRIVLFKDSLYAKDNLTDCIYTNNNKSTGWVSAYSRRAWEYNVKLALEAVELFDFNEIQFDYVRFPETSKTWTVDGYDFKNTYSEEKAQAIQTFLFYATDELHKTETYVSVDVFGESANTYVTSYGQYWPAISNIVDVISGMPYTDHFTREDSSYWTKPYNTLYRWGLSAAARQKEIPTPAKVRTWITAYNTPYWGVTTIYGAEEIYQQVKGLADAGLGSGFITWNGKSNYEKYQEIAGAFSREY